MIAQIHYHYSVMWILDFVNTAKTACSYCILPRQLMSRIGKNVLADSEFFFIDDLQ